MEGIREKHIISDEFLPMSGRMKTEAAAESLLAWIPALQNRLLLACAVRLLLSVFSSLEKSPEFLPGQSNGAEGKLLFFQETNAEYQKILPCLLSLRLPFCGPRIRNRLIYYDEYLENMTEAWEFSQDPETDSKLRQLPRIMDKAAHRLPTWRDSRHWRTKPHCPNPDSGMKGLS